MKKIFDYTLGFFVGIMFFLLILKLTGCTTTTVNIPPGAKVGNITINANKTVTTSPSLDARARDVTVPVVP